MKNSELNYSYIEDPIKTIINIPAVVSGKAAYFRVEYNHDIIHSTIGGLVGPAFFRELVTKLNKIIDRDSINSINGQALAAFGSFYGWETEDINHFWLNDTFQNTHHFGYMINNEVKITEFNPAGVTITFEFVD